MPLLEVDRVTKRYGDFVAVDDVSFQASGGRIIGLLGPNGAGKTSTIRMITHITIPDAGEIRFDGEKVGPRTQERMGYLPEERGLYKRLKVGEQLLYLAELRGLGRSEAKKRIRSWLDRLGAREWLMKETSELSKGMQQKIQFVATILPDPDLLILDEPFSGLDPINAELLKEIVLELRDAGRTIVFASHRMEQVEQMCDDICLMHDGKIVLEGELQEIKQRFGRDTVELEFQGNDAFIDRLVSEGAVKVTERSASRATLRLREGANSRQVLDAALASASDLYRFDLVTPSLNEIFVSVVEGSGPARAAAEVSPA